MTARALLLGVLAALLAACGSSSNGAAKTGAPPGPAVLRLASPAGNLAAVPAVQAFVDAVERRSGGRVRVQVVPDLSGEGAQAEQRIVRRVARGDVALGWVRATTFDTLGVTSLQPLSAPMLITSYAAEAAVLRSELGRSMLAGVGALGVTGLALLAGDLRRPFGVSAALLDPEAYRGLRFGAYASRATTAALQTLGARAVSAWRGNLASAIEAGQIDGFEHTLRLYVADTLAGVAPYAAANVVLWPHVLVLIANPALPAVQRRWVAQAAADASAASIPLARDEPALVATACAQGARFASATPAQLRALRAAFTPALRSPEIAQVRRLVAGLPHQPALTIPAGCAGAAAPRIAASGRPSPIDGVYRWTLSKSDWKRDPNYDPNVPTSGLSVFTLTLKRGSWHLDERYSADPDDSHAGTFSVAGDDITLAWGAAGAGVDVFSFRRSPGGLRMTGVSGDPGDLFVFGLNPWRKIA